MCLYSFVVFLQKTKIIKPDEKKKFQKLIVKIMSYKIIYMQNLHRQIIISIQRVL